MTSPTLAKHDDAQQGKDISSRLLLTQETINRSLRQIRLSRALTQDDVCELADLGRNTIWSIETRGAGSVDSLVRLTVVLGLDQELRDLFERRARDEAVVALDIDRREWPRRQVFRALD